MPARNSPHALARRAINDSIRTLYEDTLIPVREIARMAGVTERNIYALVRRLGCRPRVRLASGGGRRIVPLAVGSAPLDAAGVQAAIQSCAEAVTQVEELAAAARSARDKRSASKHASRLAYSEARTFAQVVRAMRDLAAITDEPSDSGQERAEEPKPQRRARYQWKPIKLPTGW